MKMLKTLIPGLFLALITSTALALDSINTPWYNNVAIQGHDPVAYFLQNAAVKGKKNHQFKWQGATWRFASEANKALFAADPEKYAPQYGGYCAWAVSQNDVADIDPEQFSVLEGKLYLNYSKKIKQTWLEQVRENIVEGNKNWPGLLAGK